MSRVQCKHSPAVAADAADRAACKCLDLKEPAQGTCPCHDDKGDNASEQQSHMTDLLKMTWYEKEAMSMLPLNFFIWSPNLPYLRPHPHPLADSFAHSLPADIAAGYACMPVA